ncbi:Hsp70 family protein [Glycomyces sp. NPDC047010]|uniref:Hsp70 family protein n=1 Tax=Glycomyces sp. NPDC047010 TaxID=3155023 RepID=UPI0033E97AB2
MSFSSPRPAAIGIDFGTSHTVATIRRADGRVHQQLFDGSPQLPSAVFMNDEGGPVVGADAVHSGRRRPERFEPNPKRRIDDESILLGETEIPVTSVIAAVLSRVARECEQTLGSLGPVTVTVPAAWGPTRRHVVADAAAAAGLGQVDLVAEPVAAASYFMETLSVDVRPGNGVVVYDLGGGTFDATVLRRNANGFEVLSVDGADDLGGLDFDQALAEHLAATVQPEDERWARLTGPSEPADLRHRTAFMDEVRQAKERLSRSATTDLTIPLLDVDTHLTRGQLEEVCAPLVARTIRVTQGVIRESGLAKDQITALFLVGAASRMPLVATKLHRELGIAPAAIEQPELAVSEGGLAAHHTISSPVSVPSPALPPQTAVPQPTPVLPPQDTNQTLPLMHPSAPQPTPQAVVHPSPVTQPAMAAPQGPPPGSPPPSPPLQYPQGPAYHPAPQPEPTPWIRSKQGLSVIGAAAAVVVLALAVLIGLKYLRQEDTGDLAGGADPQSEDAGTDEQNASSSNGEDQENAEASDGLVPISDAVTGDLVGEFPQAHVGAVTAVETGTVDNAPVAITAGDDYIVRVWNLESGEKEGEFRGHSDTLDVLRAFDYEGRTLVFSRDYGTEAVWYADDPEHPLATREASYSTVYWAGVWDGVPAYMTDYEVVQLVNGQKIADVSTEYADFTQVEDVDGYLRQVGVYENRVFVNDLATGESTTGTFDQLGYDVTAFAAGGAAGKALGLTVTANGSVQGWHLAAAEPYGTAAMELSQAVMGAWIVELQSEATALLQGDQGLSLYDLEDGTQIGELFAAHSGEDLVQDTAVTEVTGHPVAVTGSAGGDVEVWSLE